jgi:hypothetical protein
MNPPPQDPPSQTLALPPPGRRSRAGDWMRLVRPRQWTKNLVVGAGLLFSGSFTHL